MYRAIKIRLYPNKIQEVQLNKLLGCCRVVYNQCLARKIESYKNEKKTENLTSLSKWFHHDLINNPDFIWLKEQNTKVLGQSIMDMLDAYKRFFYSTYWLSKIQIKT
jgi:putative transposase